MGDGQLDHNIPKLNVYRDPSVRKLFQEKAWYSIIKDGNVLIMIRALSAVWVPCYTKPLSKIRLWIRISYASNEQEQFVKVGKLCVRILSKL